MFMSNINIFFSPVLTDEEELFRIKVLLQYNKLYKKQESKEGKKKIIRFERKTNYRTQTR